MPQKSEFRIGDKIRCRRASIYQDLVEKFATIGVLATVPIGTVIQELTNKSDFSVLEDTGGIYLVELNSLPTFEIAINSKTGTEISQIIRNFKNATELFDAIGKNPKLLGEVEYRIIPATQTKDIGRRICLPANALQKVILN